MAGHRNRSCAMPSRSPPAGDSGGRLDDDGRAREPLPRAARGSFVRLRELRDRIGERATGLPLEELSMGMSNDFETAIRRRGDAGAAWARRFSRREIESPSIRGATRSWPSAGA